jgi:bifunctional DNA-binding transcriptional regulator/antitoxin component of YhaV-PrlF toxin-antitoxin module
MFVTEKGQVTIPKHIRTAAGVAPGKRSVFQFRGQQNRDYPHRYSCEK